MEEKKTMEYGNKRKGENKGNQERSRRERNLRREGREVEKYLEKNRMMRKDEITKPRKRVK